MAALKLCFVFLSVFFHAAFLLPHLVNCKNGMFFPPSPSDSQRVNGAEFFKPA